MVASVCTSLLSAFFASSLQAVKVKAKATTKVKIYRVFMITFCNGLIVQNYIINR
jgi:hypothetical protein